MGAGSCSPRQCLPPVAKSGSAAQSISALKQTNMPGKKGKNGSGGRARTEERRELPTKGEGADYAQVVRILGDGRIESKAMDNQTRVATIRGSIYRRTRLSAGDWVLIGIREFQPDRADVLLKYTDDEVRQLRSLGLIENLVTTIDQQVKDSADDLPGDEVDFDAL